MNPRCVVALLLALALSVAGFAADKRPLTPQDLWAIKRLGSPALSPDGRTAVFTVQEWSVEKNKATTNLWLVEVASGAVRRLTTAPTSDSAPVWSPDGSRLAFLSKRGEDEQTSLYVIPLAGGEAEKILELPYALANPKWMPDGQGLVVSTSVIPELAGKMEASDLAAMKKEIKRRKESKMTAKVTADRQYRFFDQWLTDNLAHRLLLVDVAAKTFKDLTPGYRELFQTSGSVNYDISPDGRFIALALNITPRPYATFHNVDLHLLPTDGSGTLKNLTTDNPAGDDSPKFSPDGQSIYYSRLDVPYYCGEFEKLWRHDLATGRNTPVSETLDYALSDPEFSADGRTLWLTAEDRGVVPVFKLNADGTGLTAVHREGTSSSLTVAGDTVVFLNDSTTRPNELFALDAATGTVRQLTHFNDAFMAGLKLGQVESYWFKGANGADIHGWLVLPPDYDPAKTYPLVQLLHGGPHTMNRDSWSYRWNTQVFAAAGWIVTWVNRHGSTGFGEQFAQSIINEWGDKPFDDIMRSTDHLLARFPNIDRERLAAAGASYGGYMATWILGHTDRFKAIINHAGVNDFVTQYGADVTQYGFSQVLGGTPWSNPEGMQRNNPTAYARNFKTPMLVIHGQLDYRVPYANGTALYAILQAMGVPSRLVIFPDENHWVLKPQNAIYWHWEMQTWLAHYIGGQPTLAKPDFENWGKADAAKTDAKTETKK
ncbi:MAG: S9 family peptidase [Candidatus Didemnitutus sp.]|nr:S9 family peptidase [Candidatus Didemnitutus sp.]